MLLKHWNQKNVEHHGLSIWVDLIFYDGFWVFVETLQATSLLYGKYGKYVFISNNQSIMKFQYHIILSIVIILFVYICPAQIFRGYYPNGTLQFKTNTDREKKVLKGYYQSGTLEFISIYQNGKLNGTSRHYYETGLLKSEIIYNNDLRQGVARFYYPSGLIMARLVYENDKETADIKFYDEQGKPITGRPVFKTAP